MTKQDFTLVDIKDFLLKEFELKWNGEIFDDTINGGQFRKATMRDFETNKTLKFLVAEKRPRMTGAGKVEYYELGDILISVDDKHFKILFCGDYSDKWKTFKDNKKESNLNI